MRSLSTLFIGILARMPVLAASEQASAAAFTPSTTVPQGEYVTVYLQLQSEAKRYPRYAYLAFRDGVGVSGMMPLRHGYLAPKDRSFLGSFDASQLRLENGIISGSLRDRHPGVVPGSSFILALELTVEGEAVSGSFTLDAHESKGQRILSVDDKLRGTTGTVTGTVVSASGMTTVNALNPIASWPSSAGPTDNRLATPTGVTLIDNLSKARMVWRSEFNSGGMPGRAGGIGRKTNGIPWAVVSGGGSFPIVADNKVFSWRFVPFGAAIVSEADAQLRKKHGDDYPRTDKIKIQAHDVMTAIDPHTGQTLWTTICSDRGASWQDHKVNIMGQTPAYHDGRVFFVGSTQTIYALDAKTANVFWHIEDTWWQDRLDLAIASERIIYQTRGVGKQDRSHGESPIVIDGKLVVNRNGNLIALNPVDGKELWRVKKSLHKNASAHRWTHQGKDYILAYGSDMLRCLDPENGNQLWEAPFYRSSPGFSGATIVVHYSAILDNGHEKGFADDVFRVQRLSLEGPQELWSVPLVQSDDENVRYSEYCAPLILGDKVFISGRPMTSVYDLQTGERLQRFDFPSVVNAGHFQGVEDRILAQPDGKHGIVRLVPLKNSGDTVTHLPASGVDLNASPNGFWAGPHPHTTTYGPYNRHPIVDGRIFIKGNDAIYCYDLRDRKK